MRLIDADKLNEQLEKVKNNYVKTSEIYLDLCFLESLIDNSPTIGKWIPVTEKLPEEGVKVLVTVKEADGYLNLTTDFRRSSKLCPKGTRFYETAGKWTYETCFDFTTVTAWMPLPEPYQPNQI